MKKLKNMTWKKLNWYYGIAKLSKGQNTRYVAKYDNQTYIITDFDSLKKPDEWLILNVEVASSMIRMVRDAKTNALTKVQGKPLESLELICEMVMIEPKQKVA